MTRLTRCIGWTALVVLAIAAVVLAGCGGSGGGIIDPQTGSISGTLTHAGTGLPLGDITVTAGGVTVNTDANGNFRLDGIAPGSRQVVITPAPDRDLILPPPNDPIVVTVVAGENSGLPGPVLLIDGPDVPPAPPV